MKFDFSQEVDLVNSIAVRQKNIGVFGSTGSIGTQTLDVIRSHPTLFKATVLTAYSNVKLLIEQALEFNPLAVVITDKSLYTILKEGLAGTEIQVFAGDEALEEVAALACFELMMAGIVGFAGLKPTLMAIQTGKSIALANKETLVVAGDVVMKLAHEKKVSIIPVDSEHSAIFQCLVGE
jgi:1-deoxy-D-xylulose-5-phosphate reductoisomerase